MNTNNAKNVFLSLWTRIGGCKSMNTNNAKNVFLSLWAGIGAYRGHQYYNNELKNKIEYHDRYRKDLMERPKYYIITNAAYAGGFSLFYIAPIFCIAAFVYEMYELEDFMRDSGGYKDKDKDK
jgi:hypothetical protein